MNNVQRVFGMGFLACLGAGGLTACGSSGGSDSTTTPPPPPPAVSYTTQTIDATAGGLGAPAGDPNNKYTYVNLGTGAVVVLSDADAATSSDWNIAFKRSSVKLNGGLSGPKGVVGYYTGNNAEAYDPNKIPLLNWFQAATADTELPDFEAVAAAQIPADTEFKADKLVPAIKGDGTNDGWWFYHGAPTFAVTAVATNWWVIKSSAGNSYAKLHVADLVRDSTASVRRFTLEWYYQGSADTEFGATLQTRVVEVPLAGGGKYVDFDAPVDDADPANVPDWDFKIEYDGVAREYRITLNGGVSGAGNAAAFGPTSTPDTYTSGTDSTLVTHYTGDSAGGVFVDSSWYAYGQSFSPAVDHKLWPNYRIYLVKSGTDVYKLQILSYYHPQTTTESGWYTIRFEKVSP
jgi:hypothetical protein